MNAVLAPPAAAPKQLGRFRLERLLGQGAQASVWLGHDTRLDREVAVKLMAPGADAGAVSQWLHEARAVSRLTHPHLVPVFEADEHAGQSYLVFEYVAGPTLSQRLRADGAMAPRDAVTMLVGVLDALRLAHEQGIVHRDLKPSNILIDPQGRARVMDFGIAARIADPHERRIYGTPGYMSPEAARGLPPTPAMDVFAAGIVLAEMLTGQPLLRERDPMRAVERVVREDLPLPDTLGDPPDDALRAIVQRAIQRDPARRFADVAEMQQALARWLQPPVEAAVDPDASGTLEFLLRRMRLKSDFPALSDSVARIQRLTRSDKENLGNLAGEILKDVALTNKLLRMVNSAHYFAAGPVTTVSRAVALVGFTAIRNMALTLVLLDHMHDKGHARQLKEEFLRALMAGTLAAELSPVQRDDEEAFLSAMFQNLGRLLTEFYFPEEAQQIRALVRPPAGSPPTVAPPDEASAAIRVLGIGFEDLGLGVAKAWGLPESLQKSMRRPAEATTNRSVPRGPERMRWLGQAANEVTDALLYAAEPTERIADIAQRHARALDLAPGALQKAAERAQQQMTSLVEAMHLRLGKGERAQRLLAPVPASDDPLASNGLQAASPQLPPPQAPAAEPSTGSWIAATNDGDRAPVADMLAAGIQDITQHMVSEGFRLNEVLRMVLETMLRALGVRRVVFCLRDAKTDALVGRLGLGDDAEAVRTAFRVPLKVATGVSPDLFTIVCLKGADTLIADATAPNIAPRLPAWFRDQVGAPSFLLLPLMLKNAPLGLIYADQARAGAIELGEKELSLLRTLRNQAVMAFRQAGA
jgi:serine/threonine protein kinase